MLFAPALAIFHGERAEHKRKALAKRGFFRLAGSRFLRRDAIAGFQPVESVVTAGHIVRQTQDEADPVGGSVLKQQFPGGKRAAAADPSAERPSGEHPPGAPWANPWDVVAVAASVSVERGLTAAEAALRRARHGPNRLRERARRSALAILVSQFKSLIIGLLVAAAVVAFAFGEIPEGWAVVAVVVLNTGIGFFTELSAVRSMEALSALGQVTTRVRRDGQLRELPAEELVPGDIVVVEGGDVITADLRLAEASKLQADESTLTGESLPVTKGTEPVAHEAVLADRTSMLYKGTAVTRGSGTGIVVSTGMATELGAISALVAEAGDEATPLEARLDQLGQRLIWVTVGITVLVAATGLQAGRDLLLMIQTGIALAVAAIPEGLPIVATIALARGMRRMAERNALLNRLSSVETLGATQIICTDKTGTLTENRLTLTRIESDAGTLGIGPAAGNFRLDNQPVDVASHPLLRAAFETAALCNNAVLDESAGGGTRRGLGDPLEVALLAAAARAGMRREDLVSRLPEIREEAFDPDVRMMATFHATPDGCRIAVKGAPEAVLAACTTVMTAGGLRPLDTASRDHWLKRNEALAADGLRVLALAMRTGGTPDAQPYQDLSFIGLIGLEDPPRKDVRKVIAQCRHAGMDVVMITGDQPVTALGIGKAIGLVGPDETRVINGADLKPVDGLSAGERDALLAARLFARVNPRQKLELIALHQQAGHVVAMTGDGVNDAPALRKADIGVAMGRRGTQVAQEASDMVLKDDAFATIVVAIREGRVIFANIRTFVLYLMSCNVAEVMVVGLAVLAGGTLPLLPLQILFLNLVTDVFPALALGVGPGESGLMDRPPRDPREPLLGRPQWLRIAAYGLLLSASVLGALALAEEVLGLPVDEAVTISFLTLAFAQLWHVFNMRMASASLLRNEITRNPWIWGALLLCSGLLLAAVYLPDAARVLGIVPPDRNGWAIVIGMSLAPLLIGQVGEQVLHGLRRSRLARVN